MSVSRHRTHRALAVSSGWNETRESWRGYAGRQEAMSIQRRERILDEVEAAKCIQSGMTIAIGQPTPMAIVRQIVRRGLKNLTVVDSGFSLDLLIAAGCVRKVVSYY